MSRQIAGWEEELIGGADRDRTGGLLVANEALSQLSYSPTKEGSVFILTVSARTVKHGPSVRADDAADVARLRLAMRTA